MTLRIEDGVVSSASNGVSGTQLEGLSLTATSPIKSSKVLALPSELVGHVISFLPLGEIPEVRKVGKLFEQGFQAWFPASVSTHPEIFLRRAVKVTTKAALQQLASQVERIDFTLSKLSGRKGQHVSLLIWLILSAGEEKETPLFPQLKHLSLCLTGVDSTEPAEKLLKALRAFGKNAPLLSHLTICNTIFENHAGCEALLAGAPSLQNLTFQDSHGELAKMTKLSPRLREFAYITPTNSTIYDDRIGLAATVPQLTAIDCGFNVTDQGLMSLIGHGQLRHVKLSAASYITNMGLRHLVKIPHLESLEIVNLQKIKNLMSLEGTTKLTKLAFRSFMRLVDYEGNSIIAALLATYPHPENLLELSVTKCSDLDDDALQGIRLYKNLRVLTIVDSDSQEKSFSDIGLAHIIACQKLESLTIANKKAWYSDGKWQFTTDGIIEVARQLPRLRMLNLGACLDPIIDGEKILAAFAKTKSHPDIVIIAPK